MESRADLIQSIYTKIRTVSVLGAGTSARVFEVKYLNAHFAMKVLTEDRVDEFERETKILSSLKHLDEPTIIGFYGATTTPKHYLYLEYAEKGCLENLLFSKPFSWQIRYTFMQDLAQGLYFLHQHQWLHGDIKLGNLLVMADDHLKLSDFGTATKFGEESTTIISIPYTAPEFIGFTRPELMTHLMCDAKPLSAAVEVYSAGIVLWEIANQKLAFEPFYSMDISTSEKFDVMAQKLCRAKELEGPGEVTKYCKPRIAHLISWCCKPKPEDRPETQAVAEALRSPEQTLLPKKTI